MKLWVLVLLALAACAPRQQPVGLPFRAPAITPSAFVMADAARLPARRWLADNPKAVILGVHGFNDYSRAFDLPGPWFAQQGISFYAFDQRGFGSAPAPGKWAGAAAMKSDLRTIVGLLRERHPDLPLYALGVSMGGALVIATAADGEGLDVDGAILGAPAVWGWSAMNLGLQSVLWVSAHTVPEMTLTGESLGRRPTDNIELLRVMSIDPLVLKDTRIDTIYGLVGLMDDAYRSVEQVRKPVLLLCGRKDEIVPSDPQKCIAPRITSDLTAKVYPDGWHMLLRDLQREIVWQDILDWMETRQSGPADG